MKDPRQRLNRIWGVVGNLLSHDVQPNVYMTASGTKLMVEWR